jgi:hypothetical protein
MDSLLQTRPGLCDSDDCFLVHREIPVPGAEIAGKSLWIGDTPIYNPVSFARGSSLSHIDGSGPLMAPQIASNSCKFKFHAEEIDVMRRLSWEAMSFDHVETRPIHSRLTRPAERVLYFAGFAVFFGGMSLLVLLGNTFYWERVDHTGPSTRE